MCCVFADGLFERPSGQQESARDCISLHFKSNVAVNAPEGHSLHRGKGLNVFIPYLRTLEGHKGIGSVATKVDLICDFLSSELLFGD